MTKANITKKLVKGMTPMEAACLQYFGHCNYDLKVLRRWAKVLEQRAIRFYIESELDSCVAAEDLLDDYEGEKYPNLSYSEEINAKKAKEIKQLAVELLHNYLPE